MHPTAGIVGWVKLPENNYTALMIAIATQGPVAVNVDMGTMGGYRRGVFTGCDNVSRVVDQRNPWRS